MKKIGLLLFFAVFACSLSAQNRLSVFIGNANRYASVDLSDFCRRLCVEYDISAELLNNYYRRCGNIGVVGPRYRKKFSEKNSLENETIDGDSPVFEAKRSVVVS